MTKSVSESAMLRVILWMLEWASNRMGNAGCNDFPEFVDLIPDRAEREAFITAYHEFNYENSEDKSAMLDEIAWDDATDFRNIADFCACAVCEEWVKQRLSPSLPPGLPEAPDGTEWVKVEISDPGEVLSVDMMYQHETWYGRLGSSGKCIAAGVGWVARPSPITNGGGA